MIMFLQPADENEKKLPALAQHDSCSCHRGSSMNSIAAAAKQQSHRPGRMSPCWRKRRYWHRRAGYRLRQRRRHPLKNLWLWVPRLRLQNHPRRRSIGRAAGEPVPTGAAMAESSGAPANMPQGGAVASSDANGAGVGGAMRQSTFAVDEPAGTICSGSAAPAAPLAKQIVQGTDGERLSFNGGKLAMVRALATRSLGAAELVATDQLHPPPRRLRVQGQQCGLIRWWSFIWWPSPKRSQISRSTNY